MHRDIKTENILMDGMKPKIGDFGLSVEFKVADDSIMTQAGTVSFEAPEILKGIKYNYRIDIWSLGVVLFCMLFG